jgi:hypothetical protein
MALMNNFADPKPDKVPPPYGPALRGRFASKATRASWS